MSIYVRNLSLRFLFSIASMFSTGCFANSEMIFVDDFECAVPAGYKASGSEGRVFFNRELAGIPTISVGNMDSNIYKSYLKAPGFDTTYSTVINGIELKEIKINLSESVKGIVYIASFTKNYILFSKVPEEILKKFLANCRSLID